MDDTQSMIRSSPLCRHYFSYRNQKLLCLVFLLFRYFVLLYFITFHDISFSSRYIMSIPQLLRFTHQTFKRDYSTISSTLHFQFFFRRYISKSLSLKCRFVLFTWGVFNLWNGFQGGVLLSCRSRCIEIIIVRIQ